MQPHPKAPSALFELQYWFQGVITLPIDVDNQIDSARPISEEAQRYIAPSAQLTSFDRIHIYHQQYWWRLLSHLHRIFPTLTRLFGFRNFNLLLGVPYLRKCPSRHWSLSLLGKQLPRWIEEGYQENDRPLVLFSAELDWACDEVFCAPSPRSSPAYALNDRLSFQSHVRLFKLPFDLFSFRTRLLQEEVDFWFENDFPELLKDREYAYVLYRNKQQKIIYQEIEQGHWILLDLIQSGKSIKEACDMLEEQGGLPYEQAKKSLPSWIQDWTQKQWLAKRN